MLRKTGRTGRRAATGSFDAIVLSLYEGALSPDDLSKGLCAAAERLGAEILTLEHFAIGEAGLAPTGARVDSRISGELLAAYRAFLAEAPHPRAECVVRDGFRRTLYSDLDIGDRKALARSAFHRELGRFDVPFAFFGKLPGRADDAMSFGAHFSSLESLLDRRVRADLRGLVPHLANIHRIAGLANRWQTAPLRAGTLPRGTAYVDGAARVLAVDAEFLRAADLAEVTVRRGRPLYVPAAPQLSAGVERALAWWLGPDKSTLPEAVFETNVGVTLTVLPMRWPTADLPGAIARIVATGEPGVLELSGFLGDHGLSGAERAFCHHMLGRGNSVATFAATRNVTIATARDQAKSTMAKLGVRSQLDLLRTLFAVRHGSDRAGTPETVRGVSAPHGTRGRKR